MKKIIFSLLLCGPMTLFATDIFIKATKDELKKVPKLIKHKDCVLNISAKRYKEFEKEQPSPDLRDTLEWELKAKGYELSFVDYQIKIGLRGYTLESDNGPGTGQDTWNIDNLVADFSLHIAQKGGYVHLSKGGNKTYSGKNSLRDYCEVFYKLGQVNSSGNYKDTVDLRLTKRSFINEKNACKSAVKQALEYVPVCIKI